MAGHLTHNLHSYISLGRDFDSEFHIKTLGAIPSLGTIPAYPGFDTVSDRKVLSGPVRCCPDSAQNPTDSVIGPVRLVGRNPVPSRSLADWRPSYSRMRYERVSGACGGLPYLRRFLEAFPVGAKSIHIQINDRRSKKCQHLAHQQSTDDTYPQRTPELRAHTGAKREGYPAEQCRHRCHHDRSKTEQARLINRVLRDSAASCAVLRSQSPPS